tara:strand:+ start:81 stop:1022 length:942 start_codon:yes stop_codon:yes gene_type:complete
MGIFDWLFGKKKTDDEELWTPTEEEEMFKRFYENGQLEYIGKLRHGKKLGLWKYYYDTGELDFEENYKDGELHGVCRGYYKNGNLKEKGNFKDGKRDGILKFYNEKGKTTQKLHFKDGNEIDPLLEKINKPKKKTISKTKKKITKPKLEETSNSKLRVNWNDTEDIGIVTHYQGKPFTGVCFRLHDNGSIKEETEMVEGLKHGNRDDLYDNGQLRVEGGYKDDQQDGLWKYYNENGKLTSEENYQNNGKDVHVKTYHENGQLKMDFTIKNLKFIECKEFNEDGVQNNTLKQEGYKTLIQVVIDGMKERQKNLE